jgi:hypothetical protein
MENKYNSDYIRPPDKVIKQKLIDDDEHDDDHDDDHDDEYDAWFKTIPNYNLDIRKPLPLIRDTNDIWKNLSHVDDYDLEKAIQESIKDFKKKNNLDVDLVDEFLEECIKQEEKQEKEKQEKEKQEKEKQEKQEKQEVKQEVKVEQEVKVVELASKNEIIPIFKSNILRLIPFDKQLKELWDKINPIIELYQQDKIDYHLLDETTYNYIFSVLKSIRITKDEWNILETIFVKKII